MALVCDRCEGREGVEKVCCRDWRLIDGVDRYRMIGHGYDKLQLRDLDLCVRCRAQLFKTIYDYTQPVPKQG